mgnify:CR=1 FL=1
MRLAGAASLSGIEAAGFSELTAGINLSASSSNRQWIGRQANGVFDVKFSEPVIIPEGHFFGPDFETVAGAGNQAWMLWHYEEVLP